MGYLPLRLAVSGRILGADHVTQPQCRPKGARGGVGWGGVGRAGQGRAGPPALGRSRAACSAAGRLSAEARYSRRGPQEKCGAFTYFFTEHFRTPVSLTRRAAPAGRQLPPGAGQLTSRLLERTISWGRPALPNSRPLPASSRRICSGPTWPGAGGSLASQLQQLVWILAPLPRHVEPDSEATDRHAKQARTGDCASVRRAGVARTTPRNQPPKEKSPPARARSRSLSSGNGHAPSLPRPIDARRRGDLGLTRERL